MYIYKFLLYLETYASVRSGCVCDCAQMCAQTGVILATMECDGLYGGHKKPGFTGLFLSLSHSVALYITCCGRT